MSTKATKFLCGCRSKLFRPGPIFKKSFHKSTLLVIEPETFSLYAHIANHSVIRRQISRNIVGDYDFLWNLHNFIFMYLLHHLDDILLLQINF